MSIGTKVYWTGKATELVDALVKLGAERIQMCPDENGYAHVEFKVKEMCYREGEEGYINE